MIPAKSLPSLVRDLPPPLGVKGTKQDSQTKAFRFCLSLGLTQKNGEVAFKQTLDALIQRNYGEKKIKLDGGSSPGGESPQAVKEILLKRQQTVSAVDVSAQLANPGKVVALTPRRAEMSKILAEELLRMFIRKKREDWEKSPAKKSTPAAASKGKAGGGAAPRGGGAAAAKKRRRRPSRRAPARGQRQSPRRRAPAAHRRRSRRGARHRLRVVRALLQRARRPKRSRLGAARRVIVRG